MCDRSENFVAKLCAKSPAKFVGELEETKVRIFGNQRKYLRVGNFVEILLRFCMTSLQ